MVLGGEIVKVLDMVEVPCSNQGRRTILRFNFIFCWPKLFV